MSQTLDQFIAEFNGHFVAFPGDNAGYQCEDLAQFWAQNFGYPRFTGNAVNIFSQAGANYIQIYNTPSAVPEPGDLVVWGQSNAAQTGPNGHVGIFVSGDVNHLTVFNQNAPAGSPCHELTFSSYAGVLGWLRPRALTTTPAAPVAGTATVIRPAAVRTGTNTNDPEAGSMVLAVGSTFKYVAVVAGEQVTQNGVTSNQWVQSQLNHYVWAGNLVL